ncbi:ribonuclease E inhibitor RraB [uncultured Jannaschia sp.]|uniref:ribonuclease E inhibitor RraB n=1 Tax=uncultured Jannaschia sp. TaxID=293347 RepID=UPI002638BE44|nr:ribonuclease E inhibitor RraB [uncultured Jannaschia sp.]
MSGFDPAAQDAETKRQWAAFSADPRMPAAARLDLHFVPGPEADATEFIGWLEDRGFEIEHYEADEDSGEAEVIEAQTPTMDLTLDAIRAEEVRTTEAALRYGWVPTGWGFMVE